LFLNHQRRRLHRRLFLNRQRRRRLHPVMMTTMTTMTTMIIAKCKMIEPRARRVRGRAGCAGVCPRDV
jgi:multidrug efflux pump subunit AcrB